MITSETVEAVTAAFAKAKQAFKPLKKNNFNPHYKNKFSDLAAINEATEQALQSNGLVLIQSIENDQSGVVISTRVLHVSGQWLDSGRAFFPVSRADAQGFGSAITYARRYQLSAFLALAADDDDDGNAASATKKSAKELGRLAKSTTTTGDAVDDFI